MLTILFIAIALSIDAFSVSVGVGCGSFGKRTGLVLAFLFGLFQFLMPLLGASLGLLLNEYFSGTKYIAAAVLFYIAFKMYKDARDKGSDSCITELRIARMIVLALATSIDAFGVGISIALLPFNIVLTSTIIGVVCFIISWFGFAMGRKLSRFGKAEYFGAAVLLIIGIKMLVV